MQYWNDMEKLISRGLLNVLQKTFRSSDFLRFEDTMHQAEYREGDLKIVDGKTFEVVYWDGERLMLKPASIISIPRESGSVNFGAFQNFANFARGNLGEPFSEREKEQARETTRKKS